MSCVLCVRACVCELFVYFFLIVMSVMYVKLMLLLQGKKLKETVINLQIIIINDKTNLF